jgi:secreted trypsin-like serine protease
MTIKLIISTILIIFAVAFSAETENEEDSSNSLSLGGEYILEGEAPWLSPIYNIDEYLCGSSLINNQFVLTAAHCVHSKNNDPIPTSNLIIYTGVYDLDTRHAANVQKFTAKSINIHPTWNAESERFDGDIALIKLSGLVTFNDFVRNIALPTVPYAKEDVNGFVVGYGISETRPDHEVKPRRIEIPIVSENDCFSNHPKFISTLSRDTFCAGKKGVATCPGDSGSSFHIIKNSSPVLIGVVSSGIKRLRVPCKIENYAMFTDVFKFNEWIESTIKSEA